MCEKDADLVVSIPVDGKDAEGMGSLEDLEHRHQLEDTLGQLLRDSNLGHVDGGGAGGGYQEVFMVVNGARWDAAWDVVRTLLTERRLLDHATVTLTLPGQPRRQLWPSAPA
jgi:hypothetical protein